MRWLLLVVGVAGCAPQVSEPVVTFEACDAGAGGQAGAGGGDECMIGAAACNVTTGPKAAWCIDQVTGGPLCESAPCAAIGSTCQVFADVVCCRP